MTQTLDLPAAAGNGHGNGNQLAVATPRALAPVEDGGQFANLLDAGRFGHMQRVAKLFSSSRMVPEHFQGSEADCFIALQMAVRLGVDPFMFMQNTYIVYGRPGMEAKLAIALINSSGLFVDPLDYEVEGGTDPFAPGYKVRAFAVRKSTGKTVRGPWVDWKVVKAEKWDQPKGREGKQQPSKWTTMPGLMFLYRAAMFFGRAHCPERLMGMQTADELADIRTADDPRTLVDDTRQSRARRLLDAAPPATLRPVSEGQTFEPEGDEAAREKLLATKWGNPNEATPEPDVSGHGSDERPADLPPDVSTWEQTEAALIDAAMTANLPEEELKKVVRAWALAKGCKGDASKIVNHTTQAERLAIVEAIRAGVAVVNGRIVTPE